MAIYSRLGATAVGTLLFCLFLNFASAVETHIWDQSDQADFVKGTPNHLSIRSDGHVTIAPRFKELDSTIVPYLWALAQDSKGTLFYAGGAPTGASARIFALSKEGSKSRTFADIPGLEIHALAVDKQDRLYAAVLPDAKVYRIDSSGKAELFFDPHCKYIWSMVFDRTGNLFLATGDGGSVYKVGQDGKGALFAKTEEAHVRSMMIDASGNLIVGTEPSGLVLRITPDGKPFVLYQTDKREVTAIAEHDGIMYAAAVGHRSSAIAVSGPEPVLPSNPAAVAPTGAPRPGSRPAPQTPPIGALSATISGGSSLFRIAADGLAEKVWESSSDIAYAISFDHAGHPLLGTGNKGVIYRVDSDQFATQLLNTPPTQVTSFLSASDGTVYAVTGNVGNLYAIGPGVEESGTLESDVLDANQFSDWGKAHVTSRHLANGVRLETRSGNLSNPQHDWSAWSGVPLSELGGTISAPSARFLQFRLTLSRSSDGQSPEVTAVDIPFLPKNVAPRITGLELAPFNYREAAGSSGLERNVLPSGSPASLPVPAVGSHRAPNGSNTSLDVAGAATLQYSKGYVTVRWSAGDSNRDTLIYKLEIKSKDEATWRPLKDKVQEPHYSFDSATFPDGEYVLRVTASDAPSNTAGNSLFCSRESDPFTIDNTPPQITVRSGTAHVAFTAKDALSWIDKAEYSIDGGDWTTLLPTHKVTDSQVLEYEIDSAAAHGHMLAIRVFDEDDNVAVKQLAVP